MSEHRYGFGVETTLSPEEAESQIREALADEGFGILTEIDVASTLKNKLDIDVAPYRILGACNPQLAYQALTAEHSIGLLLPCNVIVYEREDGSAIEILEPNLMAELTDNSHLRELAGDAKTRLERALAKVEAG